VFKWSLSLLVTVIVGCGGSSDGGKKPGTFDVNNFTPYSEPEFKNAWHLQRVDADKASSRSISSDSNINIYDVWNQKIFGNGVKVAVIDFDFNPYHEDIASNVIKTYNVDTNSTEVRKYKDRHGTGSASIIAAARNGVGTIGVAPEASLILIDANTTNDGLHGDVASKIKAFYKAKELGAKVISCGWGTLNVTVAMSNTLQELHDDNITILFSSGNNKLDLDSNYYEDESELSSVIGVGASTEENFKADYSNYGDKIDILAPGGKDANGGIPADAYYSGQYIENFNGTSASAPIVAGVVALMLQANPNLTPDQIREILINTADKIDKDNANYNSNGFSHTHAYGKVNASRAVSLAKTY